MVHSMSGLFDTKGVLNERAPLRSGGYHIL